MFENAVDYLQFKSKLHLRTYLGIYIIFLFLYYGLKFLMSPIGGKPQTLWSLWLFKIVALLHLKKPIIYHKRILDVGSGNVEGPFLLG